MSSDWLYKGEPVSEEEVAKHAGFVYLITDLTNGKKYIGRKYSTFKRKAKKNSRRKTLESDWKTYWSSSKEVQKLVEEKGPENFRREIIVFGKTRGEVNFYEIFAQFFVGVLESDEWMNESINKWRKANVMKYEHLNDIRSFFINN